MKVARLWRYPVKSMRGERSESLRLDARGVAGDRQYAVLDAAGREQSAKRMAGLFAFQSDSQGVVFPDGKRFGYGDPAVNAALSASLEGKFTLGNAGPYHDAMPIHIVTTAALAWASADERRFRPNLVIEAEGEGQPERSWTGRRLRVGEVVLEVIRPTGRCVMVTLPQSELPKNALLLRALAATDRLEGDPLFGVYAEVVSPGAVRAGDPVTLLT